MTSVLILAGDTDGNLGDRAIVLSTCEELRRLDPSVEIHIISGNPRADREYFQATTLRRGLLGIPRLAWAALRSDRVLCGGGGLFQDDASLIKMPYWAARLAMIRCFSSHIFGFSIGVGPLAHRTSRWAGRMAFACMRRVSVRDRNALKIAERLTKKPVDLVPDPALLLTSAPDQEAEAILEAAGVPANSAPIIGVAARRWFHHHATWIPHKLAVKYRVRRIPGEQACQKMVLLLAKVLDELAECRGAHIVFLPTYCVSHEADDRICQEVIEAMRTDRKSLVRIKDPRQFKALAKKLDVMLGSRMHATIFSAAVGTPIVGLSYNQKFEGFFELIGKQNQVLRIDDFVEHELTDELTHLVSKELDNPTDARPIIDNLQKETQRYLAEVMHREKNGRATS